MNPDSELVSLIDTALGLPISESTLADLRAYNYAYENRFLAMSETERELAHRVDRWRDKRQAVKLAIKALREGFVPKWSVLLPPPPSPLVAIIGRYDNAMHEAVDAVTKRGAITAHATNQPHPHPSGRFAIAIEVTDSPCWEMPALASGGRDL